MTPMWPINAMVSIHTLAVVPRGASRAAMPCEEGTPAVGNASPRALTEAPRKNAYVAMTRKIMNRISQAPPVGNRRSATSGRASWARSAAG